MSINNGGQAFPRTGTLYPDGTAWDVGSDGMTLRDYELLSQSLERFRGEWPEGQE